MTTILESHPAASIEIIYLIMPFVAWLIAGVSKFVINSIRAKQLAFGLIGYGGMPSNHAAIVTSMTALIIFKEGVTHPAVGVAMALSFIVLLDANSLRRQIGKQAVVINQLQARLSERESPKNQPEIPPLRERIGHTKLELLGGIVVGTLSAYGLFNLNSLLALLGM
ncbi:MAG: divergent PAP2 family protein [Gammaproteobacteria bacterium]|nr:divergent PAP2 family protein [Gammaproteobacteria bacterium]